MNIENLKMAFGVQTIFDNASVSFNMGDKIGIVGVNGAGKSTLLKLILGKITPDGGKIVIKDNGNIGYLPQVITDEIPSDDITVFDYLLTGRPIEKLQEKLNDLYTKIAGISDEKKLKPLLRGITFTQNKLDYYEPYAYESSLFKIIDGMHIDSSLLDLSLKDISGGQKSKIAFAHLLYSKPDIILLDEPTNHLDIDTKEFIESYIKSYKGIVLIVSHDTEFLNKVTNKTLYVDKLKHNFELFNGNYEKYIKIKKERDLATKKLHDKQVKEEEKIRAIISKYIRGNEKKANIAKDREKKLAKLLSQKVDIEKKNKYTKFDIKINRPSYLIPISCQNLTFGYSENELLYDNLSFDLTRGERFLIIGENGIGKTTLLRLILNLLTPISGNIVITEKTDIAYYAQEHEILNKDLSILDNFKDHGLADYEIRRFLGSFLFSGDDISKPVSVLSPGERARVALAKISLSKANTLLLDEPTNHLDPVTQMIIADTFKNYEGTMLVVSHNLEFVDNLGIDRMLLLPSGQIMHYDPEIVMHYEQLNNENNENNTKK